MCSRELDRAARAAGPRHIRLASADAPPRSTTRGGARSWLATPTGAEGGDREAACSTPVDTLLQDDEGADAPRVLHVGGRRDTRAASRSRARPLRGLRAVHHDRAHM